jgi:SH3 domain protein
MAKKTYIKGLQRVTFRSGPGTTNKVLKMMESDNAVTVMEVGEQWTKVKTSEGTEGYILNRFLTADIPFSSKYKWLKSKFDKLKDRHDILKTNQKEVNKVLSETKDSLFKSQEALTTTNSSYEELKLGSTKYLELKKKYESTVAELSAQNVKLKVLESKISTYYIFWFLAGSGVLLLGWVIGLLSRKKKSGYGGGISF